MSEIYAQIFLNQRWFIDSLLPFWNKVLIFEKVCVKEVDKPNKWREPPSEAYKFIHLGGIQNIDFEFA